MRRLLLCGALWAVVSASTARAQSWIDSVLPERSFDFGTVARGSKIRHSFRVVNRLDQEIRIVDWRTKCGCTEVRVGAREIPPGTQTVVEAVIDTTRFLGTKPSGLTLVFDKPSSTEVDLNTTCFIRGDIVLTPGVVDFGIVSRSAGSTKPTTSLSLAYTGGQTNWGITRMQTRSAQVNAKLQEQGRSADGQVQYVLNVTLDPKELAGFFKDEITLFTNDSSGPAIPVAVTATVQAAVTISPSPLLLGQVKAGQVVTKTLLVRAAQPFKVAGVKATRNDVTAAPVTADAKPLHTVNLTFKVPTQTGPYNTAVEISTDLKDEPPARVTLFATVIP
jgi:Protein of unknown function (DUF1573)